MKLPVERMILAGLAVALVVMGLIGAAAYQSTTTLLDAAAQRKHSSDVLLGLEEVFSDIKDAETGQRGYLITGEERYLEPYTAAKATVDQNLWSLERLIAADPDQQTDFDTLSALTADKLAELEQTIYLRREQGYEAAAQAVSAGASKRIMDAVRRVIRAMEMRETARRDQHIAATEANAQNTLFIIGLSSGLAVVFVGLAWLVIRRGLAERARLADDVRRSRDELEIHVQERTAELRRANRALRTLSDCNQVLVRATDEAALLREVCRLLVDVGGYRLAWVGLVERDEKKTVRPVAEAGQENGYLQTLSLTWAETERGATSTAIRTGQPVVIQNIPIEASTRAEAIQRGYRSTIALPLLQDLQAVGVLRIYAAEAGAFDDEEVKLLTELANDLAYGIRALRVQAEHRRAEVALQESRARLAGIIDSAMDAIITVDEDQHILLLNEAAQQMFRCSAEDVIGQPLDRFIPERHRAQHRSHLQRFGQTGVTNRAMGALEPLSALRADGEQFPIEASISQTEVGGQKLYTVILRDITERKRAEAQIQLNITRTQALSELSRALAEVSLDYPAVLETLARRMAELIGEACAIRLISDEGQWLHPATLYHPHPEALAGMRHLLATVPQRLDEGFTGRVAQAGQPVLIPVVQMEQFRAAVNSEFWPWLERFGPHSLLGIPLRAQNRVIGVLTISRHSPGNPYTADDQAFAQDLADRAALVIMNARLFDALQTLNDALERRVAERTAQLEVVNRDLQHAKGEAERANLAKSEFLSRMSHELRTPLNAVLGFAQVLGMDELDPRQKKSVNRIYDAGRHLLTLINEVLDIARIESGRLSVSPEPVHVGEVVRETADVIQPLAAQRKIQLHVDEGTLGDRHIRADRQRITQVLLNLLSNAVKYNHAGGSVTVACAAVGERLQIRVSDTGPGIDPTQVERLFTPFERLGAEYSQVEGTGLGLALSKRLVEVMGGATGVESVLGQGSTFWVELPLMEGPVERLKRVGTGPLEPSPLADQAKTVLYVEDNLSNFKLVEEILTHRPMLRLLTAMQGRLSLDLAREHHPDLILLDLDLPDMHGSRVLAALQAEAQTQSIPVVIISADATPHQIERLLAAGARAYLTKPLDVKHFLQLVDEVLRR